MLPDEELAGHRDHLEKLVEERTAELKALNWHLQQQITERRQAEQALERTSKDLRFVNLINNVANQDYSLPKILQLVVQETKKMFSCNGATFYEISEDKKYLVMQNLNLSPTVVHQIEKLIGAKIPKVRIRLREGSLYFKALQAGKPQLINDLETIQGLMAECTENKLLRKLVPRIHQLLGIASVMQTPLISEGEVIGLVIISRKRPFTESELERFANIAQQLLLIIKRKRAEEALQVEKDKLQSVIDALEYGLTIQDRDYNILYKSGQLKKYFGDYLGDKCYRVYEGQDTICDGCPVEQAFKDGKSHSAVKEGTTPSGEVFIMERTASPIRNAEGKIVSCLEVTRDITERKQAEEKLRDATQKWMSLVENTSDFVMIVDNKGSIQYINRAIPPHTIDHTIGKALYDFAAPAYHEVIREAVAKVFETGEQASYESSVQHPSGVLSFETTMIPITEDGKVISAMSFNTNITERKEAEEREEELQQELNLASRLAAVGELAAGVAHEMNNPLTGIMGFSERLLRKSADDDTRESVDIIHREAQRLAKVVQNLLAFARQREPAKEFADINDVVQTTLELRAYELKSSNIAVSLDLAANLPQIMVDFHQIQEVFLNIILNAEQAMTEASGGGKLTIKTRPIKDYIRISFADDGPGIPAEHLDRVFNPFFTTKGERGGTGLGLSVCHGIVTEHGGRIYARSKPGSGATFLVDLPLASRKIGESQFVKARLAV